MGISEFKTIGSGKRKSDSVEDSYYTKAEYDALSAGAKKALAAKRAKRGHKTGAKGCKTTKGAKAKGTTNADVIKNLKAVQRSVSQLTKQAAADDKSTASATEFEGNSPTTVVKYGHPTAEATANRTNLALKRHLKKAIKEASK